tara:strand:- start:1433 stop:3100 length:1668 start_codon:yes stop_codon:yes gene_type:complete
MAQDSLQYAQSLLAQSKARSKKRKKKDNIFLGATLLLGATDGLLRQRAVDRAAQVYQGNMGRINELNNTVRTGVDFWANERTRQTTAKLDADLWEEGLYAERVRADLKLGADTESGISNAQRNTYINNLREDEEFQEYIKNYGQLRQELSEFKPVDNEKLEDIQARFTGQTQANLDALTTKIAGSGGLVSSIGRALGINKDQVRVTEEEVAGGLTRFNIPEDASEEQILFYTQLNDKLNQTAGLSDEINALSLFKQNLTDTPLSGRGAPTTQQVSSFRNILTQANAGDPEDFPMFVNQDDDIEETKSLKTIMIGGTEYNMMEILKALDPNQNNLIVEDLSYLAGVMKDNTEEFGVDSALITNDEYILFALQHLSTTDNLEVTQKGTPTDLAKSIGLGAGMAYRQLTTQEKNVLANTAPKALLNRISTLEDIAIEDLQNLFNQNAQTTRTDDMSPNEIINVINFYKISEGDREGINLFLERMREKPEEFTFLNQYEEANGLPIIDYSIDSYMLLREHIKGLYSDPMSIEMKKQHNEYFTLLDALRLNPTLVNYERY